MISLKNFYTSQNYWFIDETDSENRTLEQIYDFSNFYWIANKNMQYKVAEKMRTLPKSVDKENIQYVYTNEAYL